MRKLAFALVLALVPGLASAQESGSAARAERLERMSGGIARMLLERQSDLQLSADQVARLEEIAASLEEKNRPHIEALQARRAERQAVEDAQRLDRAAMREHMLEVRANVRASSQAAREVLTAEQQERLRGLLKERMEQRRNRRGTRGTDDPPVRRPGAGIDATSPYLDGN